MSNEKRFPQTVQFTAQSFKEVVKTGEFVAVRVYCCIMVLLDGTQECERVIPTAIELARDTEAEIVLVCQNDPGHESYIESKSHELQQQGIKARGYVVAGTAQHIPDWLLKSESPDAIVMAKKPTGWIGRILIGDAAAKLASRADADIITLAV